MKHVAALLLAQLGGIASPTEADVKKILSSVGVEAESDKLSKLLSEVSGKDINTLIAEGKSKLASLPAAGVASAPAAGGAAPAAAAPAAKKEEKKEDSPEEDMGFSLFD